ncbi:hypothetical protein DAEQUDRAFT_70457 [Daedalea quercina L-15889]|uniref:Uncharacterized protein n=1 Tax=Daedalea quercina L-15889 TaxID=1314783 RepID=A0A165L5W9_9APHY|nr:hypothetical protein DAEQUDRAFT_70457 [Daedalea quercina L-15889]
MPSRSRRNAIPRSRNTLQSTDIDALQGYASSSSPAASSYDPEPVIDWTSPPPESDFYPEHTPEGIGGIASRHDDVVDASFGRVSGDDLHDAPCMLVPAMAPPKQSLPSEARTSERLPRDGMPSQEDTVADRQLGHTRTPMLARCVSHSDRVGSGP